MSSDPSISLPVLVFDGDCAFCSSSVRAGQRLIGHMPTVIAYQFADLPALGLTPEQCAAAVRYVARDHRVYAGEDAVASLLLGAGRGWWFLGALIRLPGIHWLAGVTYRWVASNRHRLPGGTPACSLSDRG